LCICAGACPQAARLWLIFVSSWRNISLN
jgi:hypothetical protein